MLKFASVRELTKHFSFLFQAKLRAWHSNAKITHLYIKNTKNGCVILFYGSLKQLLARGNGVEVALKFPTL